MLFTLLTKGTSLGVFSIRIQILWNCEGYTVIQYWTEHCLRLFLYCDY